MYRDILLLKITIQTHMLKIIFYMYRQYFKMWEWHAHETDIVTYKPGSDVHMDSAHLLVDLRWSYGCCISRPCHCLGRTCMVGPPPRWTFAMPSFFPVITSVIIDSADQREWLSTHACMHASRKNVSITFGSMQDHDSPKLEPNSPQHR